MRETFKASADQVAPDRDAVFENQGIPAGTAVQPEIETLWTRARAIHSEVVEPVGVLAEISPSDFAVVYRGDGWNEPSTPVEDVFPRADDLALFVVTLGDRIGTKIHELFASNDLALAGMLDAVASAAADRIAAIVERRFAEILLEKGRAGPATGVLRYSPGYCGWHVIGQEGLFEYLGPEEIGVTLNDSFLMEPLKSVSGVIIAGPKEIHDFPNSYPFCSYCETQGCRARIRALIAG